MVARSWVGDWPSCYLLDDGWSARLLVNRRLLNGASWQVPMALGERLGLEVADERSLPPRHGAWDKIDIVRTSDGYWGSPLTMLDEVGAREGDLLFVTLTPQAYAVTLRPKAELDAADDLGVALWRCGYPPRDIAVRERVWEALSRTLGGGGTTQSAVLERLSARGQLATAELIDELPPGIGRAPQTTHSGWRPGWWWRAPLDPDESRYAVCADGQCRTAVAVTTTVGHLPSGLMVTDGGLVWVEEGEDVASRLDQLPGSARRVLDNGPWIRWARAEHACRLLALSSEAASWFVSHEDAWCVEGERKGSLLEALEVAGARPHGEPRDPALPATRSSWPVSAAAYSLAIERAVARGISSLRGDEGAGFVAEYPTGNRQGFTLLDVLA